jgi:hypothetical protein
MFDTVISLIGEAGFRPQRAATIRSTILRISRLG